jgi:hypothetical protein
LAVIDENHQSTLEIIILNNHTLKNILHLLIEIGFYVIKEMIVVI